MTGTKLSPTNAPARPFIIHGHFYQPPRENPWLGAIERQPSAAPSHDWNERIYDECYRPNAFSRLLDPEGRIRGIHNNYANMSFNFGPTLFQWMIDTHMPVVERIIEADQDSCRRLGGHGNAIAQVYNHIIMPLANRRDQLTQIRWAKAFFKRQFGRDPEGIWLAETAINLETAQCLIDEGIRFTVLAPTQAESFRPLESDGKWVSTETAGIDTRRAYRFFADKSRERYLDLFFFDEGMSKAASFGDFLINGDRCADSIAGCFDKASKERQVSVLATDGETFGHHKPFGDMCLAYLFTKSAEERGLTPVNFGYFLDIAPPTYEVTLKNAKSEGTAWSCAHGVGRWYRDCGCQTGGPDGWHQKWRTPLRESLQRLQSKIDTAYEQELAKDGIDPWLLRDIYEPDLLRRTPELLEQLVQDAGAKKRVSHQRVLHIRQLLEAQKFALFSFTSCGWFFADISGIEPMQNLRYACRALQLAFEDAAQNDHLETLLVDLSKAHSNIDNKNGKTLFEEHIRPFIPYQEILAFTGCLEHALETSTEQSLSYGFCWVKVTPQGEQPDDQPRAFEVTLDNHLTTETKTLSVELHANDGAMSGKVSSKGSEHSKKTSGTKKPEISTVSIGMEQLFDGARLRMSAQMLRRASESVLETLSSWMTENERLLDSLAILCRKLPQPYESQISMALLAQWNAGIESVTEFASEAQAHSMLTEVWERAAHFGVNLDLTQSAEKIERLLLDHIPGLESKLDPGLCDKVTYLLNIVDRFSIPIKKHLVEDAYFPIFTTKVVEFLKDARNSSDPKTRALSIRLQTFSRRLNFSTDSFIFENSETGEETNNLA